MKTCKQIDNVIEISISNGNNVVEVSTGWSKIDKVVHMERGLGSCVREKVTSGAFRLRYWQVDRTPHNPAEEGFICDECSIGISFPKEK